VVFALGCAASPVAPSQPRDETAALLARVDGLRARAREAAAAVAALRSPVAAEVAERVPGRVEVFSAAVREFAAAAGRDHARVVCLARDVTVLEAVLTGLREVDRDALPRVLKRVDMWGAVIGSCAGTRPHEGMAPADIARVDALEAAGIAAWVIDDLHAARASYRQAIDLGRAAGRPAVAARYWLLMANARDDDADGVRAADADCATALSLAREAHDERAETRALGCSLASPSAATMDALRAYRERALAEDGPLSEASIHARTLWLNAPGLPRAAEEAELESLVADTRRAGPRFTRPHLRMRWRAIGGLRRHDDPEGELRALEELREEYAAHDGEHGEAVIDLDGERGAALNAAGRYEEALAHGEAVCARADAIGRPEAWGCIQSLAVQGGARLMLRRPDPCAPLRESVERILARVGPASDALAAQYGTLGMCLSRSGAVAASVVAYQRAQRAYDAHWGATSTVALRNRLSLALVAAATGDAPTARAELARGRRVLDDSGHDAETRVALERLVGETLTHLGDWDEARELLAHSEASLTGAVAVHVIRDVRRQYVRALRATGGFHEAVRVCRDLLGGASPTLADSRVAEAALWLAEALRRDGDPRGAAQVLAPLVAEAMGSLAARPNLAVTHAEVLLAGGDVTGAARPRGGRRGAAGRGDGAPLGRAGRRGARAATTLRRARRPRRGRGAPPAGDGLRAPAPRRRDAAARRAHAALRARAISASRSRWWRCCRPRRARRRRAAAWR
jgi:tetratricopeptide (TPR) repeat protein